MTTPLLILSDAPTAGTGLGRITRDLATRIHANMSDVFEVGTLGYGGPYSRTLGFPQYQADMKDWVVFNLPEVWQDFSGGRKGILLVIWDASRLLWLGRPENCPDPHLRQFLESDPFKTWTYTPIDATGPHDRLTAILRHTLEGFNRVLAYSKWAAGVLDRTFASNGTIMPPVEWLPHGIDTSMFYPRHRVQARHGFGYRLGARDQKGRPVSVPDDALMIGIVATNQARKDWGLGLQTVAKLKNDGKVMIWAHTDVLERHWSIPALLNDFGLLNEAIVTTLPLTDDQMAWCLSACDVTLGIGNGEGWGLPLGESLACGVPVIHGNYGGGTDFVPREFLIEPIDTRIEGVYNCIRCVYNPVDWAKRVTEVVRTRTICPEYIRWENAWKSWEAWLRKGVDGA